MDEKAILSNFGGMRDHRKERSISLVRHSGSFKVTSRGVKGKIVVV